MRRWREGAAIFVAIGLLFGCDAELSPDSADRSLTFRGMTIFFYGEERNRYESVDFATQLMEIRDAGADTVVLVPYWFQTDHRSSVIARSPARTIPDADFIAACRDVRAAGLDLAVKPHIDLDDGRFRNEIDPADLVAWRASYLTFIGHYAAIAADEGAVLFVVGTELTAMSSRTGFWRDVIAAVRQIFPGQLTYAPNPQEALSVAFWDDLDYVGIDGYFPLSKKPSPELEDFLFTWGGWGQMVNDLARAHQRPVLLTEIGYMNRTGAAADPGNFQIDGDPDESLQADLYEAALLASLEIDGLAGMFWWQWELGDVGGPSNLDYTPRDKRAERVLKEYWK